MSRIIKLGLLLLASGQLWAAAGRTDYDLDDDGLIEINDLADLAEINNNLNGASLYASSAGCPTAGCKGFELTVDLNFDTNADGKLDAKDTYWNSGKGWLALGTYSKPFTAVFDGNGHIVRNLMINRPNDDYQALFGYSQGATLRNLGLSGSATSVTGGRSVGLLVGVLVKGVVQGCFSTGVVTSNSYWPSVGGLVAYASDSSIQAAFSAARVNGVRTAGGLVGYANATTITATYATGKVSVTESDSTAGGLVGNVTPVKDSYWSIEAVGQPNSAGQGLSLAQLKCPTTADNTTCLPGSTLYTGWGALNPQTNQPYWDFGTNTQLPALVLNGVAYRDNDLDGVVDSDDKFPNNPAVAVDADNDGFPDRWLPQCDQQCQTSSGLQLDQLPNSAAASVDADFDGLPEAWNASCNLACQTASGLTLDARPNDFDNDGIVDSLDNDLNNDGVVDADADHDGLVEIHSWAQLDAMRFNLSGSGRTLTAGGSTDSSGCGSRLVNGARERGCFGYELMLDLNFDTNADGKLDASDSYWNSGQGWLAIGDSSNPFSAVFEGNGHLLRNLMINSPNNDYQGLFGVVGARGELRRIGLAGKMTSIVGQDFVGSLVGFVAGSVNSSFTTGRVVGRGGVGGLAGYASGPITAVFSTTRVSGNSEVGGLVAYSSSSITASYATGAVYSKNRRAAGLGNANKVLDSYWINEAVESDQSDIGVKGTAVTLAQLQCPTTANNSSCISGQVLFANWSDYKDASGNALWSFGSPSQLPALVLNGQSYRDADGDGYLDADDGFPTNTAAAVDSDADGAPDQWSLICNTACQQTSGLVLDQFPNNAAAVVDRDLDGLPDVWNAACNTACQLASGLTLDKSLNDADNDGVADSADTDLNNDSKTDADADHNGLIDISSLTQLDAMRYSLAGLGRKMSATDSIDVSGCPALVVQGKLQRQCWGYELKTDLDFDSNKDGKLDANDEFWNSGLGWNPVGTTSGLIVVNGGGGSFGEIVRDNNGFTASFNGNGHLIRNLRLNRPLESGQGLFGLLVGAQIRDLGIVSASMTAKDHVGILSGYVWLSSVQGCFTTGAVVGGDYAGGLIGDNSSLVQAVFSTASVSNAPSTWGAVGGLLGTGSLNGGYALGKVTGASSPGGLVGRSGKVVNSYWATDSSGQTSSNGGGLGLTLAQLQCPTAADNSTCVAGKVLYQDWAKHKDAKGNAYWQFTGTQVPGLVLNGMVYRDSDADGVLNHEDNDNDNDGILDSVDAFMFNPAASTDSDGDGAPDSWNASCDSACQTASGLKLDALPTKVAASVDSDGDGFPDNWNVNCDSACQTASGLKLDAVPTNKAASVDSDGDGFPNSWNAGCDNVCQTASGLKLDAVPNNKAASVDSDGDGAPDSWNAGCDASCQSASGLKLDAFPSNKAAAVDSDGDGLPDSWNTGCDSACQTASGLKLDAVPNNKAASVDSDGDGYPDSWNVACNSACQSASGLKLDAFPNNKAAAIDADADGLPDSWNASCNTACQLASGLTLDSKPVQIFWHHKDGTNYLFELQASKLQKDYQLNQIPANWNVTGSGDLNGDGSTDLVWRNQLTGEVYLYLMKDGQIQQQASLVTLDDLSWQIAAVADFNGDHKADLLWRNKFSGELSVWLMNGLVKSQERVLPKVADLNWQLAGAGDLNGDGTADLVWRNKQTGENYLFVMQNGLVLADIPLFRVADTAWQVAALGDFNADGKTDLYWRNNQTGENYVILMNGSQVIGERDAVKVADLNWQVVASADFDGDAKADLLWRHKTTGENHLFLLDGLNLKADYPLPQVKDLNWQVGAVLSSQ